jgi:hypothetical protein
MSLAKVQSEDLEKIRQGSLARLDKKRHGPDGKAETKLAKQRRELRRRTKGQKGECPTCLRAS